jgi:hypothetical protein
MGGWNAFVVNFVEFERWILCQKPNSIQILVTVEGQWVMLSSPLSAFGNLVRDEGKQDAAGCIFDST